MVMNPELTELSDVTAQSEDQVPQLAWLAVQQAYARTVEAGLSVLIAEGGMLIEVSADGRRRVVKRLPPNIPVEAGKIIMLP